MSSSSNPHPIRCWLAVLLGVTGIAASVASIYATPAPGTKVLGCAIEALSCEAALTSQFSKVWGIPLGIFGLFYFSFWTMNLRAFMRTGDGLYRWTFSYVTVIGSIGSLTLGTLMFFVLKAPCFYCLITHSSNLLSLAILWPVLNWKVNFGLLQSTHVWHFITLAGVAILGAMTLHFANESRNLQAQIASSSFASPVAHAEGKAPPEDLPLKSTIAEAFAAAKEDGKHVFVQFKAWYCGPCQRFEEEVLESDRFQKFAQDHLQVVIYDVAKPEELSDEQRAESEAYRKDHSVEYTPTMLVFTPNGKRLMRNEGFEDEVTADAFIDQLQTVISD